MLEQGVNNLKIHALMAQGKLEMADQRVLDGNAAREKDAVGRVHTPIDRTADRGRLGQRSDDQRESADELSVANRRHWILGVCVPDSKFLNNPDSCGQVAQQVKAVAASLPNAGPIALDGIKMESSFSEDL